MARTSLSAKLVAGGCCSVINEDVINDVNKSSMEGSMVPQLVGLFEEVATEYDDILPNARLTKMLKMLEFHNPGPQMKEIYPSKRTRGGELREPVPAAYMTSIPGRCDCLERNCPGCFFPCSKCNSNKCGSVCRENRDWMYCNVWVDAIPNTNSRSRKQK